MNFSIITCTYNPNLEIFERLVNAVNHLTTDENSGFEWIIVDNNCIDPIKEISFIKDQFTSKLHHKIVEEKKPGLTNARIAGVKAAKYDWIVFFDDDNEPEKDYLINASELISQNPRVACWGPGNISVVFHKKNKNWIEKQKRIYQERHSDGEKIFDSPFWQEGYPQGTGQIIKKEILKDYIKNVENGIYSLSDRNGKNLSSGGDAQIVLNAIKNGYQVGISGNLKLQHHIEESKAKFSYLFRLVYGMASSAIMAQLQVYPGTVIETRITNKMVLRTVWLYFRQYKLKAFQKDRLLIFSQRMGNLNATCLVFNLKYPKPKLLKIVERICF